VGFIFITSSSSSIKEKEEKERGVPFTPHLSPRRGGYLTFHAERVELTREIIIIIIIIHLSSVDGG